ncbi:hypothetical protein WMF18_09650 [Sorangium sp. So ce315]|uniref:hypothetical protein n=1 Tax=Sorangium sp. So ce315 TaxID=3133299 RepID=UPI003F6214C8
MDRDADTNVPNSNGGPDGLVVFRWGRYEIENYLLHPDALCRYASKGNSPRQTSIWDNAITKAFQRNFPAMADWLVDIPAVSDVKGSRIVVEALASADVPAEKRELYMVATCMRPEEIHPDVRRCLDIIAKCVPVVTPMMEANAAPVDEGGVEGPNDGIDEADVE